jgi:hypothetical protein
MLVNKTQTINTSLSVSITKDDLIAYVRDKFNLASYICISSNQVVDVTVSWTEHQTINS